MKITLQISTIFINSYKSRSPSIKRNFTIENTSLKNRLASNIHYIQEDIVSII